MMQKTWKMTETLGHGTHLRVPRKSYPMNTSMTGSRCFQSSLPPLDEGSLSSIRVNQNGMSKHLHTIEAVIIARSFGSSPSIASPLHFSLKKAGSFSVWWFWSVYHLLIRFLSFFKMKIGYLHFFYNLKMKFENSLFFNLRKGQSY